MTATPEPCCDYRDHAGTYASACTCECHDAEGRLEGTVGYGMSVPDYDPAWGEPEAFEGWGSGL